LAPKIIEFENIPSPAFLIFFIKLKSENQLTRFEAASLKCGG